MELGKFLVNNKRAEEASPYLEELVAYFPDEGRPYYHLGYCRYFQERFDEAIALFERSIALAPNREDVYQYMAWAYFRKGDIPQAIAILQDRIEESPQEVTHYNMVSDFCFASGSPEEGHQWLDTAIALFPDQTALYLKRIQRYEEGGDLEKANFYRQALSQASR